MGRERMNFFHVCRRNTTSLEARFRDCIAARDDGERAVIGRFAEVVREKGRIALNLRPMGLLDLLQSNRLLNVYQWAALKVNKSKKVREEIIKDRLGEYYERRVAFDRHFVDGEDFKYGALSTGGLGADKYGEYCIVLSRDALENGGDVGYLQADSLSRYLTSDSAVNEEELVRDCAPDSHRQILAAIKHSLAILCLAESRWSSLLCNNDDYLEAIFTGEIASNKIDSVRIDKLDYDLCMEYGFNEHRQRLSDADRLWIEAFCLIDECLDDLGLAWETVDNA